MTRRTVLAAGGVWIAAHLLLLLPLSAVLPAALQPHVVQALAALIVAGFLPGWLLVYALVGQGDAPPPWWEHAVLAAGAAYVVLVGGMLLLSYLPGGPALLPTLALFDVITLGLALWVFWRGSRGNRAGMRSAVAESRRDGGASPADFMPLRADVMPARANTPRWPAVDRRWLLAGALTLLLVGGVLRLGNLGYADFQGDEARAALRAAATMQGYEDVLFLHKKGPTEILLPAALYVLTGHLTEATARLPFALANLAALFAAWLLGRRLFNPLAGWIAAMFFALDGYFIGFARIVQYQSVVLLMSLLTVLILYRLVKHPRALTGWLSLAALLLATGLLSHYEGALAALPAAALWVVLLWQRRAEWKRVLTATAVAAVVGGALLGAFYAPYVLNPRFAATYYYLTDRRIGGSPPYNNLLDVFLRTTLYSTTYYVLLLIGLTVVGMVRIFWRGLARSAAIASIAAVLLLVGVTFADPAWMVVGGRDWIIVPFALLFAALLITPKQSLEERVLWLWFAAVMVLALFLTEKPRTHVYTFFIPWLLICGQAGAWMYQWAAQRWAGAGMRSAVGKPGRDREAVPADLMPLREPGNAPPPAMAGTTAGAAAVDIGSNAPAQRRGVRSGGENFAVASDALSPDLLPANGQENTRGAAAVQWAGAAVAAALILLFGVYAYAFFVSTDEVMLNYYTARPPGYWVTYTEPDDKARFGFPLNNGWKVIGELFRQGELSGYFDSSEKEAWVPAWYTRGVERCPRDAQWFFEIRNLEPFSHEDELAMEHYLRQGFEKWGKVTVGGEDKLVIYQRTGNHLEFPTQTPNEGLRTFAFEDFAAAFDANAAPDLPLTYPSVDPPIAHTIGANFGDLITLEGYDISYPTPLRPGDTIRLTLYWRGRQPIAANYKVFNQLYAPGGKMQAQRDGFPVCDGRETWRWDPGELITDVYDIPVAADAEDGLYPLYTGFYLEDSGERLPVLDAAGNEVDTQVHVTDVRIGVE